MAGKLMLIEYVEEHPLFLSTPGMATKLINLYRLSRDDLKKEQQSGQTDLKAVLTDGKRISRETLAVNSRKVRFNNHALTIKHACPEVNKTYV